MAAKKATERKGTCGTYYAGSLSDKQKEANALYIYKYLSAQGWTLNAIAGLLGNIEAECSLNPGLKELHGSGFGLIQWTPGSLHINWCDDHGYDDATTMDANLAHIVDEAKNNRSWYKKGGYRESYAEFAVSMADPAYLAEAFLWNRERSAITLWGFHRPIERTVDGVTYYYHFTPPHPGGEETPYCSKKAYDEDEEKPCATSCEAYEYCYLQKYGKEATEKRKEVNQENKKQERGKNANKWYDYLLKNTFISRLDDSDKSVLTNNYWKAFDHGGLNKYTAIEDKSDAQVGATAEDLKNIKGTYTTLPNCTSWAYGRVYEITGQEPFKFFGDAGNWWEDFSKNELTLVEKGYSRSNTPSLGAIACWQDASNPTVDGHVAVVESISQDGKTISISESGYQTWVWRPSYWNVKTGVTVGASYKLSSGEQYVFKGFIHLPGTRRSLPTIEDFKLIKAKTESAEFEFTVKNIAAATTAKIYYTLLNPFSGEVVTEAQQIPFKIGKNIFTVENLVPFTSYIIKLSIADNGLTNEDTAEVNFRTLQDYPKPLKAISIEAVGKNLETSSFTVNITAPDYWGYWARMGKAFGYRVFTISDCQLLEFYDIEADDVEADNNTFSFKPAASVPHGANLQVGISTWVEDNEKAKIFAQPGKLYPVCSNSVFLKDISEISDTLFLLKNNKINRLTPYLLNTDKTTFKLLNVFKL